MKVLGVMFAVFLGGVLIVGGCAYTGYNKVVGMDESVAGNWAEVENQLQRRYDLIPNLVETVRGITGQEEKVFLGIADARKAYFQAKDSGTINQKAAAAGMVESALSRLLVLRETYPELQSSQAFRDLMVQLEGSENRLTVARKRYNDAVQGLNAYIRKLQGKIYASLAGVEAKEYFEIAEEAKSTPKVDFSGSSAGPADNAQK